MIQRTVFIAACVISAAAIAGAQSEGVRVVDNPFQDDFEYRVDSDIEPMVEIAGVRWTRFGVHVKGNLMLRRVGGVGLNYVVDNLDPNLHNPDGVKVLVIILFEDVNGNPIDRLECDRVSVSGDRTKESADKYKVSGTVLRATAR